MFWSEDHLVVITEKTWKKLQIDLVLIKLLIFVCYIVIDMKIGKPTYCKVIQ
jgi:hypothetical protein